MTFQRHSKMQCQNYLLMILIYSSSTKRKKSLFKIANTELNFLENWLLVYKISLSIGIDTETKSSFFTTNKNERKDDLPDLKLLGYNLPFTDYVEYLWVLLDDSLIFKSHIAKLCDKLKQYTGVFYLLRHNLPKHCLTLFRGVWTHLIQGVCAILHTPTNFWTTGDFRRNRVKKHAY